MRDILENGAAILEYTNGKDFLAYQSDRRTKDATERCLARISEASVKQASLAEELFPMHDWIGIRNLGNVLRHDYKGVIDRMIWKIVTDRLRPLMADLESFLSHYPADQETL
jgi:uncharacterized protein with HEPN domain